MKRPALRLPANREFWGTIHVPGYQNKHLPLEELELVVIAVDRGGFDINRVSPNRMIVTDHWVEFWYKREPGQEGLTEGALDSVLGDDGVTMLDRVKASR